MIGTFRSVIIVVTLVVWPIVCNHIVIIEGIFETSGAMREDLGLILLLLGCSLT